MESIESRLERLTPDQRKEVEDFMEFLLLKNTLRQSPAAVPPPQVLHNPPPVFTAEPIPSLQAQPVQMHNNVAREESHLSAVSPEEAETSPIHEITLGAEDRITSDYMDYGTFEQSPSPATEAVRKVKQKIIAREVGEKTHHILDWVD